MMSNHIGHTRAKRKSLRVEHCEAEESVRLPKRAMIKSCHTQSPPLRNITYVNRLLKPSDGAIILGNIALYLEPVSLTFYTSSGMYIIRNLFCLILVGLNKMHFIYNNTLTT